MAELAVDRVPSAREEQVHALTHGAGALLGLAGAAWLVVDAWGLEGLRLVSAAVYGATVVMLFAASAAYHALAGTRAKRALQALDHAAIFLLVAGTYTPVTLVTLRGPWGWSLFGTVWGLAVSGIVFECLFLGRWPRLSTGLYLLCGWVGVVAVVPLWDALPAAAWGWLGAGGIAYSAGVPFFQRDREWDHAVWHGFVLVGAICHFLAVRTLVVG